MEMSHWLFYLIRLQIYIKTNCFIFLPFRQEAVIFIIKLIKFQYSDKSEGLYSFWWLILLLKY